jgi:hypothetical protein
MEGYFVQNTQDLIGTQASQVTLTGSYTTDGTNDSILSVGRMEELNLYVFYTMGTAETGNSIEVKVSFSDDPTNSKTAEYWAQSTGESISSGTNTVTNYEYSFAATAAAGTHEGFRLSIPINDRAVWVQLKETGIAANGGSAYVVATVGGH